MKTSKAIAGRNVKLHVQIKMKPTYIGLGPPRTGTTSIHNALRYHPEIDLGHTQLLSMWQKLLPTEQLQIIKFEELIDPRSQTEVINNLY